MNFDKIKAMRNAEKFLAQGKIRAAINEYKRVVENDPNDISTLNMLGDLYVKASDKDVAIKCFLKVAEYYSEQGFIQKAIAVYNKISRLMPGSLEVSAKLANLYQLKGSVAEARTHYKTLADEYTRTGRKAEALQVWKQIATLDPNNTEIYLKIGDACKLEKQDAEAASAYIEAGNRLSEKKQYEPAISAYTKALEINKEDLGALRGVVNAQCNLGLASEAAQKLEEVYQTQPANREVLGLLADCYLDIEDSQKAETAVLKLVDHDPESYPKMLDVVNIQIRKGETEAAAKNLSAISEHLIMGGKAGELEKWSNELLAKNPEQLSALRMLIRVSNWERDEAKLQNSLERLADVARMNDVVEDERYALTQLVKRTPGNSKFADRLHELDTLHPYDEYAQDADSVINSEYVETFTPTVTASEPLVFEQNGFETSPADFEYGEVNVGQASNTLERNGFDLEITPEPVKDFEVVQAKNPATDFEFYREEQPAKAKSNVNLQELSQELENVAFYFDQGYTDLAHKTLDEIESRFGSHSEIDTYRALISSDSMTDLYSHADEIAAAQEPQVQVAEFENAFDSFKADLGLANEEKADEGDFDTHYQTGIAYKEMGLMEDSIKEFQHAIHYTAPDDGTRNYFLCCNLLGLCFIEKQMPNLALTWFQKAISTSNLAPEEALALRYEIANAYELTGDKETAFKKFEEIYVEDVNHRDTGKRLQNLRQ